MLRTMFDDWHIDQYPTCVESGSQSCECLHCGVTETEEITPNGHTYEIAVTEPTCTEQGYSTYTCTTCGGTYTDIYVDATGHTYGDWYVTVKPTCTETGTEKRDCKNCDHTENRKVEVRKGTAPNGQAVGGNFVAGSLQNRDYVI